MHRLLLDSKQKGLKLKIYAKYLLFILAAFVVSACFRGNLATSTSCSKYQYSEEQQLWLDYSGRPVSCTMADGQRIFEWIPPKGCQHWVDVFAIDENTKVSEIVIQYGSTGRKYCVLQRYINLGNSGQVLLIDGVYCLQQSDQGQNTYSLLSSCEGVSVSNSNTSPNTSENIETQ